MGKHSRVYIRISMQRLPAFLFKDENETGIHLVPDGAIVVISDYNSTGKPIHVTKTDGTGLDSSSTVADIMSDATKSQAFLPVPGQMGNQGKWLKTDGTTASWAEIFSYDPATKILTINL